MPSPIQSLLNPTIGIQELLAMPETTRLPQPKDLPTSVLQKTGLEQLYDTNNTRSACEVLLCPDIGDGHVVSPEIFQAQLSSLMAKLKQSDNPKLRVLLEEEIVPLMQNGMLLAAYRGLMLGG